MYIATDIFVGHECVGNFTPDEATTFSEHETSILKV